MQPTVPSFSTLSQTSSTDVWKIADEFRDWVCCELRTLAPLQRAAFRGDFVFVIDSHPRFIIMVEEQGAWSVTLSYQDSFTYHVEEGCPLLLSQQSIEDCISYFARSTVTTDSITLQKLLLGRIKAKVAFLTSKVTVSGDLAAFIKMVTLLKQKGVKPLPS